jgi:hypothetical protein
LCRFSILENTQCHPFLRGVGISPGHVGREKFERDKKGGKCETKRKEGEILKENRMTKS